MWKTLLLALSLWSVPGLAEASNVELTLAGLSKDELQIVNRLYTLRVATEKLPQDWKTDNYGPEGNRSLTRQQLLDWISEVEFRSAHRWTILLQNMATLKTPNSRLKEHEILARQDLKKIGIVHQKLNQRLDEFNASLKDGILQNMARKIQMGAAESD